MLRSVILTAAAVFAGTNVDDLVVLTLLFIAARTGTGARAHAVWLGQYLGIGALVAVSAATAAGLTLIPDPWIRFLGLVPLSLGVLGALRAWRGRGGGDEGAPVAGGVWAVAGVTIANGGDNIAVYTPVLRTAGLADAAVMIAVFAVLVAVWCAAAGWLGSHRRVVSAVSAAGPWLTPVVFVTLGVVILLGLL
jgi:cadmium resistance protein CadD (predicted permease)